MPHKPMAGKVVVVTGGSSGIGRAIALICAQRGASVVIIARSNGPLFAVLEELKALGSDAMAISADVTVREQLEAAVQDIIAGYERIDVWVNNAGGAFVASLEHSTDELTRWLTDLHHWGTIHGVQAVLPVMRTQGFGHIINTSSIASKAAFPFMGIYCASKAFIEAYTQALRQELMFVEKTGIKVSVLMPTAVRTPFFDKAPNLETGGNGAHLTGVVLEPDQVGRAVADAIEHYRPMILPFAPAKSLALLAVLLPNLSDWIMSQFRSDRPVGRFTQKERGSLNKPFPPFVERLRAKQEGEL